MGGIGDQIFQYSYANYLKKKLNCETYLDTTYYNNKRNFNNYKFEIINLAKIKDFKIVNNISNIDYNYLSYIRFIEILKINKLLPFIYKLFFKIPIQNFIYEFWKIKKKTIVKKNSYYFGYWHDFSYVKLSKTIINTNLLDLNLKKNKIKKFIRKINKKTVAVHIRGGDFNFLPSHNVLDIKYYEDAFNYYKKKLKNPSYHIFTNDPKLSKKIISRVSDGKNIIYLKKYKFSDIEEFSIFSKYNYSIIANSTFSLMSSYLSNKRRLSIAPAVWLKGQKLDREKKFSKLKFI